MARNGVAGTVRAIGAGVPTSVLGSQVICTTGGSGGYAELVRVNAEELIDIPAGVTLSDALALLADGRTALGLIDIAAPRAGTWVLVEAAGGGLGSLLVQLAHNAGARVIGAARGRDKLALARKLGAEVVVDYSAPDHRSNLPTRRRRPRACGNAEPKHARQNPAHRWRRLMKLGIVAGDWQRRCGLITQARSPLGWPSWFSRTATRTRKSSPPAGSILGGTATRH